MKNKEKKSKKNIKRKTVKRKTVKKKTFTKKTFTKRTSTKRTSTKRTSTKRTIHQRGGNIKYYLNSILYPQKILGLRKPYYSDNGVLIPTGGPIIGDVDLNSWYIRGLHIEDDIVSTDEKLNSWFIGNEKLLDAQKYYLITGELTDEEYAYFQTDRIPSPMDCVISGMQLGKIIDPICANLMRLSPIGQQTGIQIHQIEQMFTYITKNICRFIPLERDNMLKYLFKTLSPGQIAFCMYILNEPTENIGGHIYIIGKGKDVMNENTLYLIDPQQNPPLCAIGKYASLDPDCIAKITPSNISTTWGVLGYGPELTNVEQLRYYLGLNEIQIPLAQ